MALKNLAGMISNTTGTGTLTLIGAAGGFISFDSAGVVTGEVVRYAIRDGLAAEVGYGTYTTSGATMTRDVVENSTQGGAKINCSGNEKVFITALVSDFAQGWMPYAYPDLYSIAGTIATGLNLAANGGSLAQPVRLTAPMLLQSVSVWNTDTATERTWGWGLYVHLANDGLTSANTLTRVANSTANGTFTPGAASMQTVNAATLPTRLSPGLYWLVIQNRHASSTFDIGAVAANAFAPNTAQTKTNVNPTGATLDFVAATWTKKTAVYCVRLDGRVFGQTAAF